MVGTTKLICTVNDESDAKNLYNLKFHCSWVGIIHCVANSFVSKKNLKCWGIRSENSTNKLLRVLFTKEHSLAENGCANEFDTLIMFTYNIAKLNYNTNHKLR